MPKDEAAIADLASHIVTASSAIAFTGAGISVPSGVPPFRGEGGIWGNEFDPADFHLHRFQTDPAGFWRDRLALYERMFPADLEANSGHRAIADLEADGIIDAVITQNTDGLHAAAGSSNVVELHGSNQRVTCDRCGRTTPAHPARERAKSGELPPRCRDCDGPLKPDVILFGERLDGPTHSRANTLASAADACLVVGSSLEVEPAASIPRSVAAHGKLAIINRDSTPLDPLASVRIGGDAADILPRLADVCRSIGR